jgi:SAM-dependent methyltransferase
VLGDDLRDATGAAIPGDHARQAYVLDVLSRQLEWLSQYGVALIDGVEPTPSLEPPRQPLILDVGCGSGNSIDVVRQILPAAHWLGVDIDDSAEVAERVARSDAEFRTFDGEHLPLTDDAVDLAYSQQVFEHVVRPEPLLSDIARVLRPGGIFCGSLSQLEPFHSRSVGGFTPYGWRLALERVGLHLIEIRPGVDLGTLLLRRVVRRSRRFDRYWVQESPGNRLLDLVGRAKKLDPAERNALKLMFAGQFAFVAQRPRG